MTQPQSPASKNPWTRLFAAVNVVFIITVLIMVVAGLTGKPVRMARLMDEHGLLIIGIEVGVILGVSVVMMGAERRATLRRLEEREVALLDAAPARPREAAGPREPARTSEAAADELPRSEQPS
jgi:heme/copper-type cytochrome/quinol oxidase subunit 1